MCPVASLARVTASRLRSGYLAVILLSLLCVFGLSAARPAHAAERLLFCNTPERLTMPGTAAETTLTKGKTYRIFFHYRSGMKTTEPLVLSFTGSKGRPFHVEMRSGVGDPNRDPTLVGRQAMARYLTAPRKRLTADRTGRVRVPITLQPRETASGVVSVVADHDVRLRIYLRHDRWTLPRAKVVAFDAPKRVMTVALTRAVRRQYRRIGLPEPGTKTIYGLLYAIRVDAPQGSHVRIDFSPRGGAGRTGGHAQWQALSIQYCRGWLVTLRRGDCRSRRPAAPHYRSLRRRLLPG